MPRLTKECIKLLNFLNDDVDKEYHLKEIGQSLTRLINPRLPTLLHNVSQLEKLGLVTSTVKMQNNHKIRYYKASTQTLTEHITCTDEYLMPGCYPNPTGFNHLNKTFYWVDQPMLKPTN